MQPDTLNGIIEQEQESSTKLAVVQDHVDLLYTEIQGLDLTDCQQYRLAHRAIRLISDIQQFHKDLSNPPDETNGETELPSFSDFFKSLSEKISMFGERS